MIRTLFALACATLVLLGCGKSPTEPDAVKDPRQYTWTVDTLAYPGSLQTSMRSIWGSSPNDVYIVGHNDQNRGLMWHFDGKKWADVKLSTTQGGNILGPIDLSAIYGFAANDVWAVGQRFDYNPNPPPNFLDSSVVIHFDGKQWREFRTSGGRFLQTLWGNASNNIWAAGWEGTLLHYDGTKWTKFSMNARDSYYDLGGLGANEIYLSGTRTYSPGNFSQEYHVLLRYDGMKWQTVDSVHVATFSAHFGEYRVATIGNTLYSLGYGVYALRGGTWQRELTTNAPLQGLYAPTATRAYVVGQSSSIYYFDGLSWSQFTNVIGSEWWLHEVWATESEVFIVGHDAGGFKSIVLHGRASRSRV